jgi:hypothetical protein
MGVPQIHAQAVQHYLNGRFAEAIRLLVGAACDVYL